mgnify:CR=1 FL=1
MRVQDLQQLLSSFTEGSDAVKNAVILCEVNGTLYDIRRMEVHENQAPIVGFKGHTAHRFQRQNYIKNFAKNPKELYGIGLKTLVFLVCLICWGTILMGTFLRLS